MVTGSHDRLTGIAPIISVSQLTSDIDVGETLIQVEFISRTSIMTPPPLDKKSILQVTFERQVSRVTFANHQGWPIGLSGVLLPVYLLWSAVSGRNAPHAFGNAKTVHNNNSSRFGKFIQVFYKENGLIHGAVVEKYLLEKSRIVSQSKGERNYHVFYYLLSGGGEFERETLGLHEPQDYFYLNQSECYTLETLDGECVNEASELTTLIESMDMVGFSTDIQRRIFSVLAAVLHLGNVSFKKKTDHAHHEAVQVQNIDLVNLISGLLKVKETTMLEALTKKKTMAGGETVVMNYKMADAIATRDAMAKCLYGALFDWIVLQINHAILVKRDYREHQGNSIGVLDIFGFEDFEKNSFEQFCINYANEHLHHYFNQHIFKFEQEEYIREGIQWKNIEFMDNSGCLDLFSSRPRGLLCLLDEECNFPGATNETLLNKFHTQHATNSYYEVPQMRESAFIINHYAGRVKYHIKDFREKNSDLMRNDVVLLLKNSNLAFVRELVGNDPVAVMHWAIMRAFFRAYSAFKNAGKQHRKNAGGNDKESPAKMSRMGSVKKLKERWDQNLPEEITNAGELNFWQRPLNRKAALSSQSYLDLVRHDQKMHPVVKGTRSAPCTPVMAPSKVESMLIGLDQKQVGQNESTMNAGAVRSANNHLVCDPDDHELEYGMPLTDDRVVLNNKASIHLMKNRSFRPRARTARLRDLKLMKTLAGKRVVGPRSSKGKNKPPSVSAQFNYSLQQLMETLGQSNPFFIRCIKSNTDKAPCVFDDEIVLRQLRYTGMLATVKIRQSGYNYRLTTQEFLHQYKVLLPQGLHSSKQDIHDFLLQCDQNQENFQIGNTKFVFCAILSVLDSRDSLPHYFSAFVLLVLCAQIPRTAPRPSFANDVCHRYDTEYVPKVQAKKGFPAEEGGSISLAKTYQGLLGKKTEHFHSTVGSVALPSEGLLRELKSSADLATAKTGASLTVPKELPHVTHSPEERTPLAKFRQISGLDIRDSAQQICDNKERSEGLKRPSEKLKCDITDVTDAQRRVKSHSESDGDTRSELALKMGAPKIVSYDVGADETRMTKLRSRRHSEQKLADYKTSDERFRAECHDLYSSASDEGILSKELSSEEYLADRTDADVAKGLESEGSSGILEDSETEAVSFPGQYENAKSRESSISSLPTLASVSPFVNASPSITSTPDGKADKVPSVPFEDIVDFQFPSCLRRSVSHQSPDKPRAHSVAVLQTTAQQPGPRDLELRVGPVTKAVSEEFLQTYESSMYKVTSLTSPHLTAPLAKPETFSEFEDSLLVDSPSLKKKQPSLSSLMTSDAGSLSSQSGIVNKSPFHKARRQLKQFVTAAQIEVKSAQRELALVLNEFPSLSLQRSSEGFGIQRHPSTLSSSSLSPLQCERAVLFGTHRTNELFGQSRLSIKNVLRQSGKKKKDDMAYDSDDSQIEDSQSIQSEKSDAFKQKESCADEEDGGSSKPKLRRRNSKKKRSHKEKAKIMKISSESVQTTAVGSWSVSGTSEWQYPTDKLVNSWIELRQLEDFVRCKLVRLEKGEKKETIFDQVFNGALKEFQHNLLTQVSVTQQHTISLSYRDLMISFEEILKAHTKTEKTKEEFPITLGINAFRGFLNEFNKRKENRELPDIKYKKERKKREKVKDKEIFVEHNGHRYEQAQFSIHTYCELCSSRIWLLEKAFVCRVCRYTVHKKCYSKSSMKCSWYRATAHTRDDRVFGIPLPALLSPGEAIPRILDRLFKTIEMNWIYTEGLYRKGGAAAKIRDLIRDLNTDPNSVDLGEYHVHVLTSVIKRFLQEMPEPLFTFDYYDDVILATEITNERERVTGLYSIINKLPQSHHDLLERLMFHLAKVALNEEYNKMSSNALAIIFAPTILKTDRPQTAQDSLNVVSKQSLCVQTVIEEQMHKLHHLLEDINTLDTVTATATSRLMEVRASLQAYDKTPPEAVSRPVAIDERDEEQILSEQIALLQHRRETLTNQMTTLDSQWSSSEEDLLSTPQKDVPYDSYTTCFQYPGSSVEEASQVSKQNQSLPYRQPCTPHKVKPPSGFLTSASDDDSDGEVPKRPALAPPQLSAVGSEIIV
ncbi:hypothetical protein LSH36_107g02020 [Paralvinella palmiformis]|uniref:Unconventional myosin-IXa n=1 Tax=Paralvinella palmiformis TaxID=53620 RepID=A0AAD9N9L0_9ANNE|nr:hypothetical protein LSH36_107g02020 [Paralvinella palmiformis]